MSEFDPPPCPTCATTMRLVRSVPAVAGHPELRSFECSDCGEALTIEAPAQGPDA